MTGARATGCMGGRDPGPFADVVWTQPPRLVSISWPAVSACRAAVPRTAYCCLGGGDDRGGRASLHRCNPGDAKERNVGRRLEPRNSLGSFGWCQNQPFSLFILSQISPDSSIFLQIPLKKIGVVVLCGSFRRNAMTPGLIRSWLPPVLPGSELRTIQSFASPWPWCHSDW